MTNFIAEIVGTMMLVTLGDGVVANVVLNKTKGNNSGWIVITIAWGLAVGLAAFSVGRISGAHLNPAVTLGLASIGAFEWAQVPAYIVAQMIGGIAGGAIVWITYLPHWAETEDPDAKLAVFCTSPAIRNAPANFAAEVVGTAMLLFGILAIGATTTELATPSDLDLTLVFGSGVGPLLVGALVFAIGLSLGGPTGYAINPARDLGPRIAHALLPIAGKGKSDWGYAWLPVAAPITGGILGAVLFKLVGF